MQHKYLKFLYTLYPASKLFAEYRYAVKLAQKYRCRSVLDIGCGRGNLFKIFIEKLWLDVYIGIDIENIFHFNDTRALFVVADGRQLPVRACFDCVFFVNSLFYIGCDVLESYRDLSRYIIIVDIDPRYPHIWFMDMLESGFKGMRLSKDELMKRLIDLGFKVIEIGGRITYYIVLQSKCSHFSGIKTRSE